MFDWRVAAVITMFSLGVYNFLMRKFFADGEDWRILIPMVAVAALALAVYYAFAQKEVKLTGNSLTYLAGIALFGLLVLVFSMLAVSHPQAQLTVVIPIFALSTVITVFLAAAFLGEQITLTKGAGILLALASIYLIAGS